MFGWTISERQKGILLNAGVGAGVAFLTTLQTGGGNFTQPVIVGAVLMAALVFFTTMKQENFATGAKLKYTKAGEPIPPKKGWKLGV